MRRILIVYGVKYLKLNIAPIISILKFLRFSEKSIDEFYKDYYELASRYVWHQYVEKYQEFGSHKEIKPKLIQQHGGIPPEFFEWTIDKYKLQYGSLADHGKEVLLTELNPAIFCAAEKNNVDELKRVLEFSNVNCKDEIGMTPLHYAAGGLAHESIDFLLAHPDIDASISDVFGRTAATVAVECWNTMAKDVLEKLNPRCYPWLYPKPEDSI